MTIMTLVSDEHVGGGIGVVLALGVPDLGERLFRPGWADRGRALSTVPIVCPLTAARGSRGTPRAPRTKTPGHRRRPRDGAPLHVTPPRTIHRF